MSTEEEITEQEIDERILKLTLYREFKYFEMYLESLRKTNNMLLIRSENPEARGALQLLEEIKNHLAELS
jgi:hypothetical protein